MTSHTNNPHNTPVVLGPYALASLLVSAIEVYSRESLGFLIGHIDRQFCGGKMTKCSVPDLNPGFVVAIRQKVSFGAPA
jgi:hypothetical protein